MVRAGVEAPQVGSALTKQDLEVMKATLKEVLLEEFHAFMQDMG